MPYYIVCDDDTYPENPTYISVPERVWSRKGNLQIEVSMFFKREDAQSFASLEAAEEVLDDLESFFPVPMIIVNEAMDLIRRSNEDS